MIDTKVKSHFCQVMRSRLALAEKSNPIDYSKTWGIYQEPKDDTWFAIPLVGPNYAKCIVIYCPYCGEKL